MIIKSTYKNFITIHTKIKKGNTIIFKGNLTLLAIIYREG
jgi:hypothetical protein